MSNFIPPTRYRLQGHLGHGGFSTVYKAVDTLRGETVAIKVFLKSDDEGVQLCRKEFERTNDFRHPNIIHFYDFGVSSGSPYIVMPFFEKGPVQSYIGELSEEQIWKLIYDVGNALYYIHNLSAPVIHNDLKPDNILITQNDDYFLTDFGISMALNIKLRRSRDIHSAQREEKPTGRGPMAYRSPELFQYKDQQRQSPVKASDIWAFGACLYEIATGDPPFGDQGGLYQLMEQKDNHSQLNDIINPLPSQFSGMLNNLIFDCLRLEPWDRPQAKEIFQEADRQIKGAPGYVRKTSTAPPRTVGPRNPPNPPSNYKPAEKPVLTVYGNDSVTWLVAVVGVFVLLIVGFSFFFKSITKVNFDDTSLGESEDKGEINEVNIVESKADHQNDHVSTPELNDQSDKEAPINKRPESGGSKQLPETDVVSEPHSEKKKPREVEKTPPNVWYPRSHRQHNKIYYKICCYDDKDEAIVVVKELTRAFPGYPVNYVQFSRLSWAVYFGNFNSRKEREEFVREHDFYINASIVDGRHQ